MNTKILTKLKNCTLEELQDQIKKINLSEMTFFELGDLRGDIFNILYHQLKPLSDEMNKKYLEMKKQENLKKAS